MAGNGYLKTVNFGGFDKKDVLAYVDELNTKIYNLETELNEKNDALAKLSASGGKASANFAGKEELEKKIEESKAKISELMASADTLKLELANYKSDTDEKDAQLEKMKAEIEDLKEKLSNAESNVSTGSETSFDIGSVFIEAKNSADRIVQEAKKAAKKMETEAKELQNQMLDEANAQAERIVVDANKESETTISTAKSAADAMTAAEAESANMIERAKAQADTITEKSSGLRQSVLTEFTNLDSNLVKLSDCINQLFGDSIVKLDTAKGLVGDGLKLVNGTKDFNFSQKGSDDEYINSISANKKAEKNTDKNKIIDKEVVPPEKPAAESTVEDSIKVVLETDKKETRAKSVLPKTNKVDTDILASLTSQLSAQNEDKHDELSDEDFLNQWKH